MKKTILILLMLVLTGAGLGTAAYALFKDEAQVKGVSISTGDANLQIAMGSGWEDEHNFNNDLFQNMYPGFSTGHSFKLKNVSQSDISLNINSQISQKSGNWGSLKNLLLMALIEYDSEANAQLDLADQTAGNDAGVLKSSGWKSLDSWYTNSFSISSSNLNPDQIGYYNLWLKLTDEADDSVNQLGVNMVLQITGEQAN